MGFLEHFFDIPIPDIARIGLVEADLQLGTELQVDRPVKLIPGDEHIHTLCVVVLDLNGALSRF